MMLVRANESQMIKAMFLSAPMLTDMLNDVPEGQMNIFEKKNCGKDGIEWEAIFRMLATDYDKQKATKDPFLFPGYMSEKDCSNLPPTALFTAEFDFCRRDAHAFAERLKKAGKFLGIQDMPGMAHGYEMTTRFEEAKWSEEEW